jgi:hypothetical protein
MSLQHDDKQHEESEQREGLCSDCGRDYATPWSAPSDLWNAVVKSRAGMLCPSCFMLRAQRCGIAARWILETEGHDHIPTLFVDGKPFLVGDYLAVRGEVERLTAERDRYYELSGRPLICNSCGKRTPIAFHQCQPCKKRRDEAEASLRSLRDALETDASGRPFHMLLWEAAQALDVHGSGPLVDCLKIKSSEIERLLDALTPAAGSTGENDAT